MHDPLTVAFQIRRPWPRTDAWKTRYAAKQGVRWQFRGAFTVFAGRGLYWPGMITVWHRDPSGYDSTTCPIGGRAWRFHAHHWRIQILPFQHLRRRTLTRCAWCGGRSIKGDQVNVSHAWDSPHARWWQGEPGLFHRDCSAIKTAHATCVCQQPILEHDNYGMCARCGLHREFGITDAALARRRELAAIPPGARTSP